MFRKLRALVVLVVTATALLFAGSAYAWCPGMQRAMSHPCCAGGDELQAPEHTRPSVERNGCCEVRRHAALPSAQLSAAPSLSLPVGVVVAEPVRLPMLRPVTRLPRLVHHVRQSPIRAGPADARTRCVRLRVIRC